MNIEYAFHATHTNTCDGVPALERIGSQTNFWNPNFPNCQIVARKRNPLVSGLTFSRTPLIWVLNKES